MVVGKVKWYVSFLLLLLGQACKTNSNHDNIRRLLSSTHDTTFVQKKYLSIQPLAEIINQPIISHKDTSFTINAKTKVEIYCTGELDINWSTVPENYLFKGDDLELFFGKGLEPSPVILPLNPLDKSKDTLINGIRFVGGYNDDLRKYEVQAEIPWEMVASERLKVGDTVRLNAAVADNDDKIKQKAKLVWIGKKDPLYEKARMLGNLILSDDVAQKGTKIAYENSPRSTKSEDYSTIDFKNLAFGAINKMEDLSVKIKATWSPLNLCLFFEIKDSQPRSADFEQIRQSNSFHDYAVITNAKGEDVWNMKFGESKHSGGAFKNRKFNSIITLPPGRYTAKYVTDESHSWGNWDDSPPATIFYGIVIYRYIK